MWIQKPFFSINGTETVTELELVNLRITTFFCHWNDGDDTNFSDIQKRSVR